MREKLPAFLCIILGVALLAGSLALWSRNRDESDEAGEQSAVMLAQVQEAITQRTAQAETAGSQGSTTITQAIPESREDEELTPELPVVNLEGYDCVGYILIDSVDIRLPVLSTWDYTLLKVAPCRHFGSSRTDDLVIAGHNYDSHFGSLKNVKLGDTVYFVDMDGVVNTYTVEKIDELKPTQVDEVANSGHDLVLYTCTLDGTTRVTVFCDRTEKN